MTSEHTTAGTAMPATISLMFSLYAITFVAVRKKVDYNDAPPLPSLEFLMNEVIIAKRISPPASNTAPPSVTVADIVPC